MNKKRAKALWFLAAREMGSGKSEQVRGNARSWFFMRGEQRVDYVTSTIYNTGVKRLYRMLKREWVRNKKIALPAFELMLKKARSGG